MRRDAHFPYSCVNARQQFVVYLMQGFLPVVADLCRVQTHGHRHVSRMRGRKPFHRLYGGKVYVGEYHVGHSCADGAAYRIGSAVAVHVICEFGQIQVGMGVDQSGHRVRSTVSIARSVKNRNASGCSRAVARRAVALSA